MASFLIGCGFKPYRIAPDKDNPVYSVYLFTASPELYDAVMAYTTKNNITKEGMNNA